MSKYIHEKADLSLAKERHSVGGRKTYKIMPVILEGQKDLIFPETNVFSPKFFIRKRGGLV